MNILKSLNQEIARLAKKEVKKELAQIKKISATHRSHIAALRKQIVALQKEIAALRKATPASARALASKTKPTGRFWITGKGFRKLRTKLGLTQAVLGKLLGISIPCIVKWEAQPGTLKIRRATHRAKIQELKGKGKKEVQKLL